MYCHTTVDDFKSCGRCKRAFYYSRECQTQDWKVHKKSCTPVDKSTRRAKKTGSALVQSFLQKHARDIISAMDAKMEETGLERKDLALELNFQVGDGIHDTGAFPPSLQDPPYFMIGITKRYYEGDRPEKLSYLDSPDNKENIDGYLESIRGMHEKTTNDHVLICVGYPTNPAVERLDYSSIVIMALEGKIYFDVFPLMIDIIAIGIKKLICEFIF